MRLPFPERIPVTLAFIFAVVLGAVQQLEGTDLLFSVYSSLFVIIAAIAFNTTGGFTRPSGGYVFFYSFGVIAGVTGKAIVGEPADSNLVSPNVIMLVFLGGISSMLVAVFISRRLISKRAFLQNVVKPKDMRNATIGCIISGLTIQLLINLVPHGGGSILSALNQVNQFLPIAIILGTIHQIRKTGGASAMSLPVALAFMAMFGYSGLIAFSKQGMFTPIACWAIAAASMRYKLRPYELVVCAVGMYVVVHFFVPYSQVGRNYPGVGVSVAGNLQAASELITQLGDVREEYTVSQAELYESGGSGYYNNPQGLLDRLQILKPDDALINVTNERGSYGYYPIYFGFLNLIPHVFFPSKPTYLMGNVYAHEVGGIVADEDESTGISFSPSAEAYHVGKWAGVLVVAPILWIMLFTWFDSLCGDVRKSPWGLLVIALFSHIAPEGMLGGVIYMLGYTTIGLVFAVFASAYVMPIIGTLIVGPEQVNQRKTVRLLGMAHRRDRTVVPAEPIEPLA
jgi:hypothetical protein